jgi:hypothetical protein
VAEWDVGCAETRTINNCPTECGCSVTPAPTPTPGGDCCTARNPVQGGTGCDVDACEACVCGRDPLCCNRLWDADCVLEAREECASVCPCAPLPTATPTVVPTPGGDCCTPHDGPSCDETACRECVCDAELDPACCTGLWDDRCVEEATLDCALACSCEAPGNCCEPHGGVGCEDATCKSCVCDRDPACCTIDLGWDADCVSEAMVECAASCTCEVAGSCCEAHEETVGCDDNLCQVCVCALDEACCEVGWDGRCVEVAATDCHERCAGCEAGCCDIHPQPGCVDEACETCVCDQDDFCCNPETGEWDGSCVDFAFGACASTCQCETPSACPGDCDNSDSVQINELISCVNIALGNAPLSNCPACDPDGGGSVAINELIAAVNASLTGCPA